jgi:hypothetical protein
MTLKEANVMGEWFEFKCHGCGYRAEVSGGEDCGMIAVTETMVCENCQELVDVQVGYALPLYHGEWDKNMTRCPVCHSDDVTPWEKGWPCPKCGKRMVKGGSVCLWD